MSNINIRKNKTGTMAEYVKMVFALFVITAVTAGVLAAVNILTKDVIAKKTDSEIQASFANLFGEDVTFEILEDIPDGALNIYEISAGSDTYYCVNLKSSGFGGNINILVSFDTAGKIAGISVVSHSETPGFGTLVFENSYLVKYNGKTSAEGVDSIAGATVSSKALKAGISTAQNLLVEAGLISQGGESK